MIGRQIGQAANKILAESLFCSRKPAGPFWSWWVRKTHFWLDVRFLKSAFLRSYMQGTVAATHSSKKCMFTSTPQSATHARRTIPTHERHQIPVHAIHAYRCVYAHTRLHIFCRFDAFELSPSTHAFYSYVYYSLYVCAKRVSFGECYRSIWHIGDFSIDGFGFQSVVTTSQNELLNERNVKESSVCKLGDGSNASKRQQNLEECVWACTQQYACIEYTDICGRACGGVWRSACVAYATEGITMFQLGSFGSLTVC